MGKTRNKKGYIGRGCLCEDEDKYSVECCKEKSIYTEGIGKTRKIRPDEQE